MKIIGLKAENVKRLTCVEITPEGTLITVGGKNGAGKSSVLDAIAYALGGAALIPSEPIRKGESQAKVEVDLGDMVVIRKFTREFLQMNNVPGEINDPIYGPTKSSLVIKNKDGATYPSPQAILDKLLGKLTFDPLKFSQMTPLEQQTTLKKLVNLDTTELESKRAGRYNERTELKRKLKSLEVQLEQMPLHEKVPPEELSVLEVTEKMAEADRAVKASVTADLELKQMQDRTRSYEQTMEAHNSVIDRLMKELETEREKSAKVEKQYTEHLPVVKLYEKNAAEAQAKLIPTDPLRARLLEIEATNVKVRANQEVAKVQAERNKTGVAVAAATMDIEKLDEQKEKLIAAAQFPVPGLGFKQGALETGVTYNGVPLEQASTAEQLQISVAIGLALNPGLKVLLIRNGNALDDDSLKAVAEQAEKADAQIWMEYVTQNPEGVSVMLEDGHVVETEEA